MLSGPTPSAGRGGPWPGAPPPDIPFYFYYRGPALDPSAPDPIVDLFVKDITEGIAGGEAPLGVRLCGACRAVPTVRVRVG